MYLVLVFARDKLDTAECVPGKSVEDDRISLSNDFIDFGAIALYECRPRILQAHHDLAILRCKNLADVLLSGDAEAVR